MRQLKKWQPALEQIGIRDLDKITMNRLKRFYAKHIVPLEEAGLFGPRVAPTGDSDDSSDEDGMDGEMEVDTAPPRKVQAVKRSKGHDETNARDVLRNALTERMYLVSQKRDGAELERRYTVMEVQTEVPGGRSSLLEVVISYVPSCTCSHRPSVGAGLCKHVLFVLHKVLKLPLESKFLTQVRVPAVCARLWSTSSTAVWCHRRASCRASFSRSSRTRPRSARCRTCGSRTSRSSSSAASSPPPPTLRPVSTLYVPCARRHCTALTSAHQDWQSGAQPHGAKKGAGRECSMCREAFGPDEITTSCTAKCGGAMHQSCMQLWTKHLGASTSCPVCGSMLKGHDPTAVVPSHDAGTAFSFDTPMTTLFDGERPRPRCRKLLHSSRMHARAADSYANPSFFSIGNFQSMDV